MGVVTDLIEPDRALPPDDAQQSPRRRPVGAELRGRHRARSRGGQNSVDDAALRLERQRFERLALDRWRAGGPSPSQA